MKTVTCHSCNRDFTFDPRKPGDAPDVIKNLQKQPEGVVTVLCPHCKSLRKFLVTTEKTDEHQKLQVDPAS